MMAHRKELLCFLLIAVPGLAAPPPAAPQDIAADGNNVASNIATVLEELFEDDKLEMEEDDEGLYSEEFERHHYDYGEYHEELEEEDEEDGEDSEEDDAETDRKSNRTSGDVLGEHRGVVGRQLSSSCDLSTDDRRRQLFDNSRRRSFYSCNCGDFTRRRDVWGSRRRSYTCSTCSDDRRRSMVDGSPRRRTCCAGSYGSNSGLAPCVTCSAGKYSASNGASTCTTCVGGESRRRLSLSCSALPAGTYDAGDQDDAVEVPCPENSSPDVAGKGVATGCTCNFGYVGSITATTVPPYFSGGCQETITTTETTIPDTPAPTEATPAPTGAATTISDTMTHTMTLSTTTESSATLTMTEATPAPTMGRERGGCVGSGAGGSCPSRCGDDCGEFMSKWGYCGSSWWYQHEGTDCRGCSSSPDCPHICYPGNHVSGDQGGSSDDLCTEWVSLWGYCGSGSWYSQRGQDCRLCRPCGGDVCPERCQPGSHHDRGTVCTDYVSKWGYCGTSFWYSYMGTNCNSCRD